MSIQTVNPATEQVLETYPLCTQAALDEHIEKAHAQFHAWKKIDMQARADLMLRLGALLCAKTDTYATLMAQEMGKPLTAGKAEIEKCARVCDYYAEHAATHLADHFVETEHYRSKVCYEPLGIIFAVMPWNFPFWQVFRFAVPNIMAGNIAILKHAPISTGTGYAIQDAFIEAGFPQHVFSSLALTNEQAATVIGHKHVMGVTFTGSESTGKIIAACAGSHLKKVVMELGGSDPYVVLHDADLDLAAQIIVASRLNNNGQTCIAAKRVIVVDEVADALCEKIVALTKTYRFGDPMDIDTKLGPMAREDLRSKIHQQVLDSVAKGATLQLGGTMPEQRGFYYPPTILTDVRPGMPAFDEELFGPVFAVITAKDETDAIALANQTQFGLGSAVFTRDLVRGERIASLELHSGQSAVNSSVVSDPRLPFGGVKHSGYGRELSQEGIREFVNIKTVVVHESKA
ncbi:MAG: NAD-dependent succinate-semialdehyde dehydrogenase [Gammaproteobacteria bacterium]|nr:NAD-dependent succinate-semialdehyde dehydrogenase [Gammaproteobacteria bacterium]